MLMHMTLAATVTGKRKIKKIVGDIAEICHGFLAAGAINPGGVLL